VDKGEEGIPFDSDVEECVEEEYDNSDQVASNQIGSDFDNLINPRNASKQVQALDYKGLEPTPPNEGQFRWTAEGNLRRPTEISNRVPSRVRPEKTGVFATPLSALFGFVPIRIFKGFTVYSNMNAHFMMEKNGNGKISGATWHQDISLSEMMTFFGILWAMVLRPTPGQPYPYCWKDPNWHPYTKYMRLRRFQQIRSVIYFNERTDVVSNDALYKVRPLLNCLKITFPSYLEVGDETALDEASVASRSRYGGDVIFFNPSKPGGKFHFRFYLLCCASTYACIRIRMHTRNTSDDGDGYREPTEDAATMDIENDTDAADADDAEEQTKPGHGKLVSLVLDMCKQMYGTGRVVNMDNYYTSPAVAVALLKEEVYIRGTCRSNRKGFPTGVMFSRPDATRLGRGSIKTMIDKDHRIAAYGWVDGNPVHFLTTADGTSTSTVQRRVGRDRLSVKAPIGIKNYNKGMQAVDRHDQLRERFSLSSRHGFKKYYVKIALGLLDMAAVNAWIHFKLVNPDECKKETARYDFFNELSTGLLTTDWNKFLKSPAAKTNESVFRSLFDAGDEEGDNPEDEDDVNYDENNGATDKHCVPMAVRDIMPNRSKRKGYGCQVCAYEGRNRGLTSTVVVCLRHRLRLCTVVRKEDTRLKDIQGNELQDYSWRPPLDSATSCWKKAHDYYIPNGLFRNTVQPMEVHELLDTDVKPSFQCVRVGSDLYKKKRLAFGQAGNTRGRKRKANSSKAPNTKKASAIASKKGSPKEDDDYQDTSTDTEDVADVGVAKNQTSI
jgi:hypothetical protein